MEAFRQFYTANKEKLFGYLVRKSGNAVLASDLVQESFTRYLEKYRHRELSLALLFTIGRNLFYDQMRQQRRCEEMTESTAAAPGDEEQKYIHREDSQLVLDALQQLDEDDRDLLALVVSSGMTYREVARIHGCSEGAVKVRVHRARRQLRCLLSEK